jgi:hypothetical protein
MKIMKLEHVKSIFFLFMAFMIFSCDSSDDNVENNEIDLSEINATATSGSWVIALFEEDGVDQTSDFSGYSFTFNADGILNVAKEDLLMTGSWSITSDSNSNDDDSSDDSSSDDDDSSDDVDFNIFFSSSSNFEELSEDWEIVSYTETRIELKHVSGGDGSIDVLVFEKQ